MERRFSRVQVSHNHCRPRSVSWLVQVTGNSCSVLPHTEHDDIESFSHYIFALHCSIPSRQWRYSEVAAGASEMPTATCWV